MASQVGVFTSNDGRPPMHTVAESTEKVHEAVTHGA